MAVDDDKLQETVERVRAQFKLVSLPRADNRRTRCRRAATPRLTLYPPRLTLYPPRLTLNPTPLFHSPAVRQPQGQAALSARGDGRGALVLGQCPFKRVHS